MILVIPNANRTNTTSFQFTFYVSGEQYGYWEKLIVGPNGFTYYIIALVCAGIIGLSFLTIIIFLIVRCAKRKNQQNQIQNIPNQDPENKENSMNITNKAINADEQKLNGDNISKLQAFIVSYYFIDEMS